MLKEWANNNGLADVYTAYEADVDAMVEGLQAEGLPTSGSTYEVRLEAIRERYPELFGEQEVTDAADSTAPVADHEGMVKAHQEYEAWERTEEARAFMEKHLPPEAYQEFLRDRAQQDDLQIYLDTEHLQVYTADKTINLPIRYRERVLVILEDEDIDQEEALRQVEADLEADPDIIEALR